MLQYFYLIPLGFLAHVYININLLNLCFFCFYVIFITKFYFLKVIYTNLCQFLFFYASIWMFKIIGGVGDAYYCTKYILSSQSSFTVATCISNRQPRKWHAVNHKCIVLNIGCSCLALQCYLCKCLVRFPISMVSCFTSIGMVSQYYSEHSEPEE